MRRRAEYEYGDELPLIMGGIAALGHPYDLLDAEADELAREVEEAVARRRPIGFVKWDDEEGVVESSAVSASRNKKAGSGASSKQRKVPRTPSRGRTNTRRKAG